MPFVASKPSSTGMERSMKIRLNGPVSRASKASMAAWPSAAKECE